MPAPSLTYTRPALYPKQSAAFFHPYRYGLTEASTKAGKTVAAIAWILEAAFAGSQGQNFWWVAPVSDQAKIAYTRIKNNLTRGTFRAVESPTPKIILINGAEVWFKSGDNPDSLYGEDVYAAVVDEASRCKEESWHALRSTLTATQGPVRIIGNVKGRKNWFYAMARQAEKDGATINMHYSHITVLDAIAAGVIPQDEVEDARRTLPENVFRELYMAEPADDTGNPFGQDHIRACTAPQAETPAVAFGIDLAKKNDWFVVVGLDASGSVCAFQRWQGVPWGVSVQRVHDIVGEDVRALVDSTGLGDPVLEQLQVGHGNFEGYHFTPGSKQKLMEGLVLSIQSHELIFPPGPIVLELDSFEYEYTRLGVRYTAPSGLHDDCVMALALAREMWSRSAPGTNMIEYMRKEHERGVERAKANLPPHLTPEEILDNELHQLYLKTLAEYAPAEALCRGCGKPLTGHTQHHTDGEHKWHVGCL